MKKFLNLFTTLFLLFALVMPLSALPPYQYHSPLLGQWFDTVATRNYLPQVMRRPMYPATLAAFDITAVSARSLTSNNLLSLSATTSGSNRLLVVAIANTDGASFQVSAITFNGTAMTSAGGQALQGGKRVAMFYQLAPTSGTFDVAVTMQNIVTDLVVIAYSLQGALQVAPTARFGSASGTSTTPSRPVTSASLEIVIDTVTWAQSVTGTPNAGQTLISSAATSALQARGSRKPGEATAAMDWTLGSSTDWAMVVIPIAPAV